MANVSSLATGSSNLGLAGLASGFDWQSLISQLVTVERSPEQRLRLDQNRLQQQNNAFAGIKTELTVFQNDLASLKDPGFFDSRTATASDPTLASATAAAGAALGSYSFSVTQLASAASWRGATGAGASLSTTDDVSALTLSSAGLASPITAGTFTVNGKQITIATTDTLKNVLDQISTATGGAVTASYSSANDAITLSSASEIVLGSATDSSNFLQAMKLANNGSPTVTSASRLGAVKIASPLSQSNLATAVTGDVDGNGTFTINGVPISYSTGSDSITNVLKRINDSGAGVVAGYDATNNRFTLMNRNPGDIGIALADVTGNFLAASGLSGGALAHGSNLLYSLNDGPQLSSQTNTISEATSGITGLSVTALDKGDFAVTIGSDTNKVRTAIANFVAQYNKVQSVINAQTASSTDANGKVTAGLLAGDQSVESLIASLRNSMNGATSSLSGARFRLDSLGFVSNGHDDSLSTTDLSGLDTALTSNLGALKDLFTHAGTGLAVQLDSFITATIGDKGSMIAHQSALTTQSAAIDTQISSIEKHVSTYQQNLTAEFVAMETAQAQINQQMQYLSKTFGSG